MHYEVQGLRAGRRWRLGEGRRQKWKEAHTDNQEDEDMYEGSDILDSHDVTKKKKRKTLKKTKLKKQKIDNKEQNKGK